MRLTIARWRWRVKEGERWPSGDVLCTSQPGPFSSLTTSCSAAQRPKTQVSQLLCIPSSFHLLKLMSIITRMKIQRSMDRIHNSTNLLFRGAWHTTKRDRGVAEPRGALGQFCNAWHMCIVKATVKLIYFSSNNLQFTTRCPQKLHLVSK